MVSVRAHAWVYVSCHQLESIRFEEKKKSALVSLFQLCMLVCVRGLTQNMFFFCARNPFRQWRYETHQQKKRATKTFYLLFLSLSSFEHQVSPSFFFSLASFLFSHLNLKILLRSTCLDDKSTREKRKECYQLFQNSYTRCIDFVLRNRTSYSLLDMRTLFCWNQTVYKKESTLWSNVK